MLTRSKSKQMRSKANSTKKSKGSKLRVSKSQKKNEAFEIFTITHRRNFTRFLPALF